MNPTGGVILFTVIEVVTMVGWLKLVLDDKPVAAIIVLAVGLFLEHLVSYNVGTGQPYFRFPARRPK